MNSLLFYLLTVLPSISTSLISSNNSNHQDDNETRGRSCTTAELPSTNNNHPQIALDSSSAITTTLSADRTEMTTKPPLKPLSKSPRYQAHFQSYIFLVNNIKATTPGTRNTSNYKSKNIPPHQSPIILQLNVIDQIIQSRLQNLSPNTNEPLMAAHMALLRDRCRQLASQLGPLNPKARNCAFRYHELSRFLGLVHKYKGAFSFDEYSSGRNHHKMCTALVENVKKLVSLVDRATFTVTAALLRNPDVSIRSEIFRNELKALEGAIETLDDEVNIFCNLNIVGHDSINIARDSIAKFLDLAFNY